MPRSGTTSDSTAKPLIIIFAAEFVAVCALKIPLLYNFDVFAFGDWGSFLTAEYLIRNGAIPNVDFGWQYGLLPLLLQRIWFGLAGTSPAALLAFSLGCALVMAALLASFARLEGGVAARTLALLSLPIVVYLTDFPHSLEPVMLTAGLYFQARHDLRSALVCATGAVFVKASMGYMFGLLLVILALSSLHRRRALNVNELARALLPAACTALTLGLVSAALYGPAVLLSTLVPLSAAHAYRTLGWGWPSLAKLLYFPGVKPGYYFGGPGFWALTTTFVLVVVAHRGLQNMLARRRLPTNYYLVFTCGLLELVFILAFYGAPASWLYYAYMPLMGALAAGSWSRCIRMWLWPLCLLALLADLAVVRNSVRAWRTFERSAAMAGLYAPPGEIAEWSEVASLVRGEQPVLFGGLGGAAMLFPWSSRPVGTFMLPGIATRVQVERELDALRSAKAVVIASAAPPRARHHPSIGTAGRSARRSMARTISSGENTSSSTGGRAEDRRPRS